MTIKRVRSEDYSIFQGYWFCYNGDIIDRNSGKIMPVYENGTVRLMNAEREKEAVPAHRLVAMAFVECPKGYTLVKFKDGNKKNRDASNLFWAKGTRELGSRTKEILSLWDDSYSAIEIAEFIECSPQYVNRVVRDHRRN